jgi:hypothetical protein
VGDVHEADVDLSLDALQLELHHLTQLQVERAEGLVQKQGRRLVHQGARQRHPLLLAARQLRGLAVGELAQADHLDDGIDLLAHLGRIPLLCAGAVGDVVPHVHVGKQGVVLKHRVDVALVRRGARDVLAIEPDGAARRGFEAGDHAQGGRLAAAGRAQQREELALPDREVGVVDGHEVGKRLGHMVDLDDRWAFADRSPGRWDAVGRHLPGGGLTVGGRSSTHTSRPLVGAERCGAGGATPSLRTVRPAHPVP